MKIKTYDTDGVCVQVITMNSNSTLSIRNKPGHTDFYTIYCGGKDIFADGRGVSTKRRGEELIEALYNALESGETEARME